MRIKTRLYQATKGSSLFDYTMFNKDKNKESDKNKFLSLLFKSITKEEYFDPSPFVNIEEHPIGREITQVALADATLQNEEFEILEKLFTSSEIEDIIKIINRLKSYGVVAIKELMDSADIANKRGRKMRPGFFSFFR